MSEARDVTLSKRAALKLHVEPGTFVFQLTQPSIEPSCWQNKRRKLGFGKYFPIELPGATGEDVAVDADPAARQPTPAGPHVMTVETTVPVEG